MKVTNTKGTQGVSKSKKSSKSSEASGVSFDALVEAAGSVEAAEAALAAEAVGSVESASEGPSRGIPSDAEGRGKYMLDQLEDLEKDILSGNDTGAVQRLQEAIDTEAQDMDRLDPELKEILDEIEARASIEIAKMSSED
ncbi:MAG: hypothetical protein ACI9TY_001260 [Alphaproteobacteria bacterium]|jgi:hypothetical protein